MTFRIGYCTSGFQSHRLEDALAVLADLGYEGVFLTLDVGHLDPFADGITQRIAKIAKLLSELDLVPVVETGARFLLDPTRKHQPTLLSPTGFERRIGFLIQALDIARDLGAKAISTWSGAASDDAPREELTQRLVSHLSPVLAHAERVGITVGFEPEPGMLIETVKQYEDLADSMGRPDALRLSLDVGHLLVTEEGDPATIIKEHASELAAVAIEDMVRGVHDHLPFGDGDLDLPPVLRALSACGFDGVVAVELARHSHDAVNTARRSKLTLERLGVRFRS